MPVKWSSDKDQLLLLKILETHEISVDAKKISAAWPTDQGETPTARAITERLVKIRQNSKAVGANHFPISSSQSKISSGRTTTPRKQLTPASKSARPVRTTGDASASPSASPSPLKRRRISIKPELNDSDDDELVVVPTPAKVPKTFRTITPSGHDLKSMCRSPPATSLNSGGRTNSFTTWTRSNKPDWSLAETALEDAEDIPVKSAQSTWGNTHVARSEDSSAHAVNDDDDYLSEDDAV